MTLDELAIEYAMLDANQPTLMSTMGLSLWQIRTRMVREIPADDMNQMINQAKETLALVGITRKQTYASLADL